MKLLLFACVLACNSADITDLQFLSGCWAGKGVEEQWNQPLGGQMMGMARTVKGPRVVFSEFMRIQTKDGVLVFTPRIGTKAAPVDFKAIKVSATEVVFENLAHDFPKRIIYRQTEGGLFARVEDDKRVEDFPMRAVPCSGGRRQP
jgi:hypothetical protein